MVRTNSNSSNETIDVMNLDELRKDIIDRLKDVDNSNELRYLLHMVEQMILSPFDPNDVTPVQWRIFNDALEAAKRGNYITGEESSREIDSWK